jgi:hypothetical protein
MHRISLATLVVATMLVLAPRAEAQLLPSFGIAGGLNFANVSDAVGGRVSEAVGYHIGGYGDFGFGPVGVRGSVLYVRAGDIAVPSLIPLFGANTAVEFIAVPVDLKFRAGFPLVNPYALVGPELRFPLGDLSDHPNARGTSWAANLGVGADIGAFIGPQVFAELRYGLDLTGFLDDPNESVRVSVFYLRLGIGF